jgi:hypothetical protein
MTHPCPVEWDAHPVELHVPPSELLDGTDATSQPTTKTSAPSASAVQAAHHFLLFSNGGSSGTVKVAPLVVKAADESTKAVPKANEAASCGVQVQPADVPVAAVGHEEWTDAVDDEVMAFFGDDDESSW